MKRPDRQRRQLDNGLRALEKGDIVAGLTNLVRAGASVELSRAMKSYVDDDVRTVLEKNHVQIAVQIYTLLEDEVSLLRLARSLTDKGQASEAERVLEHLQVDLAIHHMEFVQEFLERGAYAEALKLMRYTYSPEKLEESKKNGSKSMYAQLIEKIVGHLNGSFERYVDVPHTLPSPVRHLLDMLRHCEEDDRLLRFYSESNAAGRSEWTYATGIHLLDLAWLKNLPVSPEIATHVLARASERNDRFVQRIALLHQGDVRALIAFAREEITLDRRQSAEKIFEELLKIQGVDTGMVELLRDLLRTRRRAK